MEKCGIELYWLPVGAGEISRPRQWSLAAWEALDAALHRRPRASLYHAALKIHLDGRTRTLEMTPAFIGEPAPPLMTGPVGFRGADRFRVLRYQLRCLETDRLPDEEYAVGPPKLLAADCSSAGKLLDLASAVPPYVWGLRARGTTEMWTSDSVVSWLLVRTGIETDSLDPPPGGRAPGWQAGLEAARAAYNVDGR